ncbi:MAG: hypothetical protein H0U49_01995 [Parachlamydiaceae bacterium]|nr:hypothetical protein [Parachlamydiaceae bacterium]
MINITNTFLFHTSLNAQNKVKDDQYVKIEESPFSEKDLILSPTEKIDVNSYFSNIYLAVINCEGNRKIIKQPPSEHLQISKVAKSLNPRTVDYNSINNNKFNDITSELDVFVQLNADLANSGPQQGWHILLKTHGGVKELALGSVNRVTLALHINSGRKKVFRSTKKIFVTKTEVHVNHVLENIRPDLFATGSPVTYQGPFRIGGFKNI